MKRSMLNTTSFTRSSPGSNLSEAPQFDEYDFIKSKFTSYDSRGQSQQATSYGRVNFLGHSQTSYAPYVCISKDDNPEDVVHLMLDETCWNLDGENLKLVLSVIGGSQNLKLTPVQKSAIKLGITKSVEEAGAWIFSGGTDTGIMKICGEAAAEYKEEHNDEKFVLIGMATWGKINNKEFLKHDTTRSCQTYHKDQNNSDPGPEFNHTHLIFVDDGKEKKFGVEIEMRTGIQEHLTNKADCQCVCLLVEGGLMTADITRSSLMKNIPVVVLDGSGRFADALAWAKRKSSLITDKEIQEKISHWCKDPNDQKKCCTLIRECLEKEHLIFIQKLEPYNSESIYQIIMHAFVVGYYKDQPENQLKKALEHNQLEIASEIFRKNSLFDIEVLKGLLLTAIIDGKTEFIKLLTENGVNFRDLVLEDVTEKFKEKIKIEKFEILFQCEVNKCKDDVGIHAAILIYLTLKKDIASLKLVLQNLDEPLANCLYICNICELMRVIEEDLDKSHFHDTNSIFDEFEKLAVDIIDRIFETDESSKTDNCSTNAILLAESSYEITAIQQGIRAQCRKFIATEAVQSLFAMVWHGEELLNQDRKNGSKFEKVLSPSPRIKCIVNNLFTLCFVFIFTIFLMGVLNGAYRIRTFANYFFLVTNIAFLFEEFRQCYKESFSFYVRDFWNIIDIIGIVSFFIGYVNQSIGHKHGLSLLCYVITLLSYYVKIMHVCHFSSQLGPKIVMIRKMLYDLGFFLVILMIFLTGFGVVEFVLLNESSPIENSSFNVSLENIFNVIIIKPYFRLYGELFLDELLTRNTRDNMNIFVIGIYMILTNVLLLNMLIAMFGYTFSVVQSETDTYWKFYRFKFLYEYSDISILPGPLKLIFHAYIFLKWVYKKCCNENSSYKRGDATLRKFENEKFKDVIWKRHIETTNCTGAKLNEIHDELKLTMDTLSKKLDKLLEREFLN